MPELPEVETVRKALLNKLKNKKILDINVLHNNVFENQDISFVKNNIKNQEIKTIKRRGKWLVFELDVYYLLSHLRMEGKYLYRDIGQDIGKHELVVFNISNEFELRYKDVRKFGKMYLILKDKINDSPLAKLGYEPWDDMLDINYLKEKYKNKSLPIKTLLLDQTIITGIGNIYADEILFLSKTNPIKKGKDLNDDELKKIIDNTRIVLHEAIKQGGTTIRSYTSEEGITGLFQNNLNVHQKEGKKCPVCDSVIKKIKVGGRGTYYCEKCQK